MKKFAKLALGAAVLAGAAAMAATPADARVSVGFGIGVPAPVYYGAPYYNYTCDPYSRFYDPYRCGYYAPSYGYGYGYGGPSLVIGGSFGGGFRDGGGFRSGGGRSGGGRSGGGHR
jgi:uncharacterized membrane protein YgcG